jgi:hypothetical protein
MLYLPSVLIASDTSKASINLDYTYQVVSPRAPSAHGIIDYTYKTGIAVRIKLMSFSKTGMKAWKENKRKIW